MLQRAWCWIAWRTEYEVVSIGFVLCKPDTRRSSASCARGVPFIPQGTLSTSTWSHLVLNINPAAAERWVDKMFVLVEGLSDFPEQGRKVPEIGDKLIREIISGNYRIIYKQENGEVLILTVRHVKQVMSLFWIVKLFFTWWWMITSGFGVMVVIRRSGPLFDLFNFKIAWTEIAYV